MAITALGVGSGLDLNGLLDQLTQAENKKLTPITTRKQDYQTKISAFGSLSSALAALQTAAHALGDPKGFQAVTGSVTGTALAATTTNDTPPGFYQIHVDQRAQTSSVATLGVADQTTNLGAGTLAIALADGTSMTVAVDAAHSSLASMRDAINAQDGPVRASLVNDGSGQPWRLVLRSATSGAAASLADVQFTGDLGASLGLDAATRMPGQDAKLTINGVAVTSPGNVVEGAIQGTTLTVTDVGDAALDVTQDNASIKSAVTGFVDSYNKLVKTLGSLTSYDADSQAAGVLLGDSTVRSVQTRLRSVLGGAVDNGGAFRVLSDAGVTLQLDGTLKVDDAKLSDAVAKNANALRQLFAGNADGEGIAAQLDGVIGDMTGTGGLIGNATDGLNSSIKLLDQQYDRTQQQIDATIARYRSQFSQLDSMIAKMNSTSTYLTQQFDALSKMTTSGK